MAAKEKRERDWQTNCERAAHKIQIIAQVLVGEMGTLFLLTVHFFFHSGS